MNLYEKIIEILADGTDVKFELVPHAVGPSTLCLTVENSFESEYTYNDIDSTEEQLVAELIGLRNTLEEA